jgi:hypothetical protein
LFPGFAADVAELVLAPATHVVAAGGFFDEGPALKALLPILVLDELSQSLVQVGVTQGLFVLLTGLIRVLWEPTQATEGLLTLGALETLRVTRRVLIYSVKILASRCRAVFDLIALITPKF